MKRGSRGRGNRSGKERAVSPETGRGALGGGLEVAEPRTGGGGEEQKGHWGLTLQPRPGGCGLACRVGPPASGWPASTAEAATRDGRLGVLPRLSRRPPTLKTSSSDLESALSSALQCCGIASCLTLSAQQNPNVGGGGDVGFWPCVTLCHQADTVWIMNRNYFCYNKGYINVCMYPLRPKVWEMLTALVS